jgi:hypothetical protein
MFTNDLKFNRAQYFNDFTQSREMIFDSIWKNLRRNLIAIAVVFFLLITSTKELSAQVNESGLKVSEGQARPAIDWVYPWKEDWSVLADPSLRTDPFDCIKYIPIGSNPKTYLSFGVTIRQRFETVSVLLTPLQPDDYFLDRTQIHADLHLGSYCQIFTQISDIRADGKTILTPVDQDRLDLEQGFIAVTIPAGQGAFGITVGRQEPDLDRQRFVSIGDGPNVRNPFDSFHIGYKGEHWHIVAFYSQPVIIRDQELFDDISVSSFTISGLRVEQSNFGPGRLSLFAAQLRNNNAFYLTAKGGERRNVLDIQYAGRSHVKDWDIEGMVQGGHIGAKTIRAWGVGGLFGYTWIKLPWSPRLGIQLDAASGTENPNSDKLGTFNPLFPNGYYELLAGYPGYANFVHLKLSAMVFPAHEISTLLSSGFIWRETTADAVYLLPMIPVFGTAGRGTTYSGAYFQIRFDWAISDHLASAIDAQYFAHSPWLRQAGAKDGHYILVELRFGI